MNNKKKNIAVRKKYLNIKILTFFIALFLIALIGLLIPLRPTESVLEKRELEKFPSFTLASFWDGSYFSQISTWYADTFPFRETLLSLNSSFQGLYGVQGEQIISTGAQTGDEIPEEGVDLGDAADESEEETEEETLVDGTIDEVPEVSGDVYVSGDTAFSIFYFSTKGANAYVEMIDKAQKKLNGLADIYTILVPTSIGVNLSESVQTELNSSNQKDAINYIYSSIESTNSAIKTVEVYDTLKAHNSEYLYFRTDHHWTALAAYYAYKEFCSVRGFTAASLDDYETMEFTDFLGSFYSSSNQAASLKSNPDTITAYIPTSTNEMVFWDSKDVEYEWKIVYDVSGWNESTKYNAFVGGDEPYAEIDNPILSDGSACVVIKESYGNIFIPFLVDHYDYVYIVDYRYFYKHKEYGNSVYSLVKDKGITDVIFINNVEAMDSVYKTGLMSDLFD